MIQVNVKCFAFFSADYFKNIADDYMTVAIETAGDMKAKPIKSSFYVSLLTGIVVLIKTKPGETEFHSKIIENSQELHLVSDLTRNPNSEKFMKNASKLRYEGRLKYRNLIVCSLMCESNYSSELGIYEAKCKYVKPHWTEFHKTIIDVGVFGRWWKLEDFMKDYDVNPGEWKEDGTPNPEFEFNRKSLITWDMKM